MSKYPKISLPSSRLSTSYILSGTLFIRLHRASDSPFSSSSSFNEFGGFVNWGFLLLAVGGSRLALENVRKYGVRVDPRVWLRLLSPPPDHLLLLPPVLLLFACNKQLLVLFELLIPKTYRGFSRNFYSFPECRILIPITIQAPLFPITNSFIRLLAHTIMRTKSDVILT
jgi:hypothetical protein